MKYRCVTVWHKTTNGTYKRFIFERAVVREVERDKTGAASNRADNSLTVRIFGKGLISPGDRLKIGSDKATNPPYDSYIISSVTDNRDVSAGLQHFKAVCI